MGVALPIAMLATTVIGAGVSAYSAYSQGNAASAQAKYQSGVAQLNAAQAAQNQQLAQRNATYIEQSGAQAVDDQARDLRARIGAQRAAMAANGLAVDSGTNAEITSATERLGDLGIANLRTSASRQAAGMRINASNADMDRMMALSRSQAYQAQASSSQTAGFLGAATSILGGATKTYDQFSDMRRSGVVMPSIPAIMGLTIWRAYPPSTP